MRENASAFDLGAGLGVATLPALRAGALVMANDIDNRHLDEIKRHAEAEGLETRLVTDSRPLQEIGAMGPVDAVHASNVLHFLSGAEIEKAMSWMWRTLKPGGKAFIQMQSPFCGHFQAFYPEYERRKSDGLRWPGEIEGAKRYAPAEIQHLVADFNHVMEAEMLSEVFRNEGFEIEFAGYYTRPGLPEVSRNDGRENLGLVARKPD